MLIENIWSTFEEIEAGVGCELHPWQNAQEESRLIVWHPTEEKQCVYAG